VVQDVTLAPALFEGADDQPISIMSKIHLAEEWLPDSRRGNSGVSSDWKNYFYPPIGADGCRLLQFTADFGSRADEVVSEVTCLAKGLVIFGDSHINQTLHSQEQHKPIQSSAREWCD